MLQLAPLPQKVLDPEKIDLFYPWPEKVWLRANMVQSLDSAIVDQNGTTKNLSGEIDKKVFRTLRQLCDVVIIGSNTAQKSPYQDFKISEKHQIIRKRLRMPEKPRLAVISNNLNISKEFFKDWRESNQVLLYTHQNNEPNIKPFIGLAEIVYCGQRQINLKSVKQDLVRRSFKRILCEGGPSLLHSLLKENLVDEIDLTIETKILNTPDSLTLVNGEVFKPFIKLLPHQLIQHEKTLLLRYLVQGHRF